MKEDGYPRKEDLLQVVYDQRDTNPMRDREYQCMIEIIESGVVNTYEQLADYGYTI